MPKIKRRLIDSLDASDITALYLATKGACPIIRGAVPSSANEILDPVIAVLRKGTAREIDIVARCAGAGYFDKDCFCSTNCPIYRRPRLMTIEIL